MKRSAARWIRLGAGLLALMTLGWILTVQAAGPQKAEMPAGLPTDWSHQHVIFSQPGTAEAMARVENDPRYWQQWARRNLVRAMRPALQHDWSQDLGSGASVGAGNYPAKYSFQTGSANCASATTPDYVVYGTGQPVSATQATIAAYDNLYSGCTGTVPSVYWAYYTGGQVITSPVISGDGTQVAFVETNGLLGILVVLKWKASTTETVSSPMTLVPVANSAYRSCTAPCMTEIFLATSGGIEINDTTSSPFPDYTHDTIWVGGALGWLHKITGVFRGNPAEATSGGFPVQVNTTNPTSLSSPVYDYSSTNVYVGDYGGYLYRVTSSGGVTASGKVDHGTGVVAAPVVDSTSEKVYVFSSSDGSATCPGAVPCSGVFQFATTFGSETTGSEAPVGSSSATPNVLYEGAFDNNYLTSATATGNLYVCGNTGGPPIMYQVPISAGAMQTVVAGPVLSNTTTGCSPVSDVSNPNTLVGTTTVTTDWFYAGLQAQGLGNSCASGGCAANFVDTPWIASHTYVAGQEILDTHFQIQVVRTAGTSKATEPAWGTTVTGTTDDNGVHWLDQGPQAAAHATWQASTAFTAGTIIVDSNNNIQFVATAGTSKATAPTWNTTVNAVTADGGVRWRNLGALATNSQAAAGGTSGFIIDNTVGSGTLAGASQVYYSTQSNQSCGTSGTGGCAVQASQSALQ